MKTFKTCNFPPTYLFVSLILLLFSSCRTTPENEKTNFENITTPELSYIKINSIIVDYQNNPPENNPISENNLWGGGGNSLTNNKSQPKTHIQNVGEGLVAEIEQVPYSTLNGEYFSSNSTDDLVLAIPGESLPNGTKYGILIYKETEDDYIFDKEQVFTVGKSNPTLTLKTNQTYTLIIYSIGTDFLPVVKSRENFDDAHFDINTSLVLDTGGIFYQQINNFRVTSSGKAIDIRLENRTYTLRLIIDTSNLFGIGGKEIAKIEAELIRTNDIESGPFELNEGYFRDYPEEQKQSTSKLTFRKSGYGMEMISNSVSMPGHNMLILKAKIRIDFLDGHSIERDLIFKGSYPYNGFCTGTSYGLYNYRLKLTMFCFEYFNVYNFMCYNLGVTDFRYSPFHPRPEIRGKLYNYLGKEVSPGTIQDKSEIFVDPCPKGWKMPDLDRWGAIMGAANQIGDFKGNESYSGVKIGKSLVLPATGYLDFSSISGNKVRYHNSLTYNKKLYYWSSEPTYNVRYYCCEGYYDFQKENPMMGQPVRCIRDGWVDWDK